MIFMSMVFLSSGIGASVAVYGSTVSLSALKDSDLNIDLTDACPAKLLKNLYQTLKDDRSGNQCCFALLVLFIMLHYCNFSVKHQMFIHSRIYIASLQRRFPLQHSQREVFR